MTSENPLNSIRENLERLSVGLVLSAVVTAMVLGNGASVGARIAVQSIAGLAMLATIASMVVDGSFRIVRFPLWIAPAGLVAIGLFQLIPLPSIFGGAASLDSLPRPAPTVATANRHATQEAVFLWCGVLFVSAVAGHQIRTQTRARTVATVLGVALLLSGLVGAAGLLREAGDSAAPTVECSTVIGPLAYRPKLEFDSSGVWLAPTSQFRENFGGFWDRSHWIACAFGFIPLIVVAFRSSGVESSSSLVCSTLPLFLAATLWLLVVVIGDPWIVGCAGALSATTLAGLAPSEHRRLAFAAVGLGALVAAAGFAARSMISTDSGSFAPTFPQWVADNRSLASALWDLGWLGGGLGALADVWPMYRDAPAEVASQASSLLSLIVEAGVAGFLLLIAGVIAAVVQWKRVSQRLDPATKLLTGALAAGLVGMLGIGLLGPGVEAPGMAATAALLIGCFSRGASGPNAWPHGGRVA